MNLAISVINNFIGWNIMSYVGHLWSSMPTVSYTYRWVTQVEY